MVFDCRNFRYDTSCISAGGGRVETGQHRQAHAWFAPANRREGEGRPHTLAAPLSLPRTPMPSPRRVRLAAGVCGFCLQT